MRHAVRQQALAGWAADQLRDDLEADQAPARAHRSGVQRPARPAADQGADGPRGRAQEARVQPRRRPRHAAPAGCDLRDRPERRGDRRQRGGPPRHPDRRGGRHELQSAPGRVRDPGQRRRDPLLRADRQHARRGDPDLGDRLSAGRGGQAQARGGRAQEARGGAAQEARGGRGQAGCRGRREGRGGSRREGSGREACGRAGTRRSAGRRAAAAEPAPAEAAPAASGAAEGGAK